MNKHKSTKPLPRLVFAVVAGSGFSVATNSALAEPGIYVGGAYGIARVDSGDFDDDTHELKAFVGGKFNDFIGVEAAANDYGEAKGRGYKTELNGYTLALVGYLPLGNQFDLFAKAGNLWWRNDYTILGYSDDFSGNELFYGLGAQFNFNENFALRLEMERYKVEFSHDEIGFNINETFDVDVASVGVVFTF